jgi:hypothetical protein
VLIHATQPTLMLGFLVFCSRCQRIVEAMS